MKSLKLLLFACLCVISVTAGSLKYDSDEEYSDAEIDLPGLILPNLDGILGDDAPPKPCCLPKQWQSTVTTQSGWTLSRVRGDEDKRQRRRGGFQSYTATAYVDEDKKKVAGRLSCGNDTCGYLVVFGANMTADTYLFKTKAQKCWHNKSRAEFRKQCLPADAKFEASVNLGPATQGLGVQVWSFRGKASQRNAPRPEIYMAGRAIVTPSCVPVVFQEHGLFRMKRGQDNGVDEFQNDEDFDGFDDDSEKPHPRPKSVGGKFMGSSYFSNFVASIKDPSVFNPPTYCKGLIGTEGNLNSEEEMEYPDIIDRFVMYK